MLYDGFIFKHKKFNEIKLKNYGFTIDNGNFKYSTKLMEGLFELTVNILPDGRVDTTVVDISTGENYDAVYVKSADGKFVGQVKCEFETVLSDICEKCTNNTVFITKDAYRIIEYIDKKYSDKPEYLWEKFPNNAIFREQKSQKWYAAILTTTKKSIGLTGDSEIEVINLKALPDDIEKRIDNKRYFPAYHMNKKHWYSICLDFELQIDEIFNHIDESYNLIKRI